MKKILLLLMIILIIFCGLTFAEERVTITAEEKPYHYGDTITLRMTTTIPEPYSISWYVSTDKGATFTLIEGENSCNLDCIITKEYLNYVYRVDVEPIIEEINDCLAQDDEPVEEQPENLEDDNKSVEQQPEEDTESLLDDDQDFTDKQEDEILPTDEINETQSEVENEDIVDEEINNKQELFNDSTNDEVSGDEMPPDTK